MTTIDARRVTEILMDCLHDEGEEIVDYVEVEGVIQKFGLKADKLEEHRDEIVMTLYHLPKEFLPVSDGGGGGWSFMNMPFDENMDQWGEQYNAEQLLVLGMGIRRVTYLLPRDKWKILPGSVPYLAVT